MRAEGDAAVWRSYPGRPSAAAEECSRLLLAEQQSHLDGLHGGLGAVGDAELLDDALDVGLTVERPTMSSFAIWRLVLPEAIRRRVSTSLAERTAARVTDEDGDADGPRGPASVARRLSRRMASPWSRGVSPPSTALTASSIPFGLEPLST